MSGIAESPSATPAAEAAGSQPTRRRRELSADARALIPLVVAMVIVSAFAATRSEEFLTVKNFSNIFADVAVLGVLAVGATIVLIAGQLDLSIGSGVSLATVVAAKLLSGGSSEVVAALVVLALAVGIGFLWGAIVTYLRVPPFILTLGGLSVLAAVAQILSEQRPIPTGLAYAKLSLNTVLGFPLPLLIVAGLCVVGAGVLRFTSFGRNVYAIGSNEEAAYLSGVPVGRTKILVYVISGLTVGLASFMMLARLGSGDPTSGVGLELEAITAVVLGGATLYGGRGSMLGTFLGVFLLGLIGNALTIAGVLDSYKLLIYGLVLIAAVTWATVGESRGARGSSGRRRLLPRRRVAAGADPVPRPGDDAVRD